MRFYLPTEPFARTLSHDGAARLYIRIGCPAIMACQRCEETGALLVDFIGGATLEIYSGERELEFGRYLHLSANARAWLGLVKAREAERKRKAAEAAAAALGPDCHKERPLAA